MNSNLFFNFGINWFTDAESGNLIGDNDFMLSLLKCASLPRTRNQLKRCVIF